MNINKHTLAAVLTSSVLVHLSGLAKADVISAAVEPPKQIELRSDLSHAVHRAEARADHEIAWAHSAEPVFLTDQNNVFIETLGGPPRPRTLVIHSGEPDAKDLATLEEDLAIMSRVLSKSLKEVLGNGDVMTAMGMKLRALAWPSGGGIQNFYLEGYGALFLLNVGMPLLPPPNKDEEEKGKGKTSSDSTWEEAKRELYGPKEEPLVARIFGKEGARPEYDAKKVEKLKDALIPALKNATNIRGLKPEEFVTVTVIGAPNPGAAGLVVSKTEDEGTKGKTVRSARVTVRSGAGGNESVLTLRAKKADVDKFAEGDLNLEQFRKRVTMSVY